MQSSHWPWRGSEVISNPSMSFFDAISSMVLGLIWTKQRCQSQREVGRECEDIAWGIGAVSKMYIPSDPLPVKTSLPELLHMMAQLLENTVERPALSKALMEIRLATSDGECSTFLNVSLTSFPFSLNVLVAVPWPRISKVPFPSTADEPMRKATGV